MSSIVSVERDGEIAVLIVDNPPVNAITQAARDGLRKALKKVSGQTDIKAVVLTCAGRTFFSGADITEFFGPPKEAEFRELFGQIEAMRIPVVAALFGTALGGGLEISLACHYRVAAPSARVGFPEINLGIIPGAGGTQRMPRLIGADATLDMIFAGAPRPASDGIELGFIDAIIDGDLKSGAIAFAKKLVADSKSPRRTSEMLVRPETATPEIFQAYRDRAKKQFKNRATPDIAVRAVEASVKLPFDKGLLEEERLANESKATPDAKALIHLFFAERQTGKIPDLPKDVVARPVKKIAIIGAGTMGGGIATCFANTGIPATIIDINQDALDRGMKVIDGNYQSRVKRGRMTQEAKDKCMSLISGSVSLDAAADVDLVIEAVFEKMELKQNIFRDLDRIAKPGAILGTNTSTLDINEIAAVTGRPQDVIGLHFFSPANVMPLLEVVRAEKTAPDVIRTAMDLARPLRKTAVLARVCFGFIGNRMMEPYGRECERMVLEGATPREVDDALLNFGMAMGLLSVFDMGGVDVGYNVHVANADKFPPDPAYYALDKILVEAGRMGQKNGKGYYRYEPGDRTRHDDPAALALFRKAAEELQVQKRSHSEQEIVERCFYSMINEGARILEEGVAIRASDIDVVYTSGYGFPRYRGGPMFYADSVGLKTVYEGIMKYREIFGPMHWEPSELLVQLVKQGKSFADWERERAPKSK
jgi:3-hydroxyacyl-CoA dehydrogenase